MGTSRELARREAMEKIKQDCLNDGGIKVFLMWKLRDAAGWSKLGSNVIIDIANLLEAHGLRQLPARSLPTYQDASVRLYVEGSPVGRLIESVLNPSNAGDEKLRQAANNDAVEILDHIRDLVCSRPTKD